MRGLLRVVASAPLRLGAVVALATAAIVAGTLLGRGVAGLRGTTPGSAAPSRGGVLAAPPATPSPLVAAVTKDAAIALVASLEETVRVDRIEAKLVTWSEFTPVGMGVDRAAPKLPPAEVVWAVAVAGDVYPTYWGAPLGTPRRHFAWALWGVDAMRGSIASLKVDGAGTWPPGFDALRGRVAVAPTPSPVPPARIVFDLVKPPANGRLPRLRELAAADPAAEHLWAIVDSGAIMRSDDGGAHWRAVPSPTHGSGPAGIAAAGAGVLVSDMGLDTADRGTSTSGGVYLSRDDGATWREVLHDGARGLTAVRVAGETVFLAELGWADRGAATGPSRIAASNDGETWRMIGGVPGPARFALADVPLVSWSKDTPGDGIYRVEGRDLASLRLVAIAGSAHVGALLADPAGGALWSFTDGGAPDVRRSADGGRTWTDAGRGLGGRIAGLFVVKGVVYALGDGAFYWAGTEWRIASFVTGKGAAIIQIGDDVFIQDIAGDLWRWSPS